MLIYNSFNVLNVAVNGLICSFGIFYHLHISSLKVKNSASLCIFLMK